MIEILAQIKDCLGITDDTQDSALTLSIKKTLGLLECFIGCNPLAKDENGAEIIHSERIPSCYLDNCSIALCVPYVKEIVSIDGQQIPYRITGSLKRCIELDREKSCECSCKKCKSIEILYKGGIVTLDNCLLQFFLEQYQTSQSKCDGKSVKKIQMLDKTVEYCCDLDYESMKSNLETIKLRYKKYQTLYTCCH